MVNSTCALVQLLLCPPIFASSKRRFDIGALLSIIKALRAKIEPILKYTTIRTFDSFWRQILQRYDKPPVGGSLMASRGAPIPLARPKATRKSTRTAIALIPTL